MENRKNYVDYIFKIVCLSSCVCLSLSLFSLILLNFLTDDEPGSCVSCVYLSPDSCFYYEMTPCELDLDYKCKYIPYLTSLKTKTKEKYSAFPKENIRLM